MLWYHTQHINIEVFHVHTETEGAKLRDLSMCGFGYIFANPMQIASLPFSWDQSVDEMQNSNSLIILVNLREIRKHILEG